MPNGLEKLERLFAGSRRKEKMRRRVSQQMKAVAVPGQSYSRSSPIFPSPSYLRPMSMHMMPREAQVDVYEREKGRSQSVPNTQDEARRCSSIASSITAVDSTHICSDHGPGRSMSRRTKKVRDLQTTPVKSHFQFPEDSLFKHSERQGRISGETTIRGSPSDASPYSSRAAQSPRDKGLLDWTPKHVSLLFDPLDINVSFNHQEQSTDVLESLLLPSPMFDHLDKPKKKYDTEKHDTLPLCPSYPPPRLPEVITTQILNAFPRKQSLSPFDAPYVYSPPASDDGGNTPTLSPERSFSHSELSSPKTDFTPRTSVETTPSSDIEDAGTKSSIRETWGNRFQDPNIPDYSPSMGNSPLRPRLIGKSTSIATLPLTTSLALQDHILKEPTFDDFYSLSDDDIAENQPATPSPPMSIPPTPPPKDTPPRHKTIKIRRRTPISTFARNSAWKPTATGEITPPCTPTDSKFLPMTCSSRTPRDTLGAIRVAELAAKYNFAVVYVVSLWPEEGGDYLDPSRHCPSQCGTYKAHGQTASSNSRGSNITSRLLAAYGLSGIPSPFRMVTDVSINALNRRTWGEHRNPTPGPYDITHGWIRSYHTDCVPVSSPARSANTSASSDRINRGIVFAAYVKKTSNSKVPMEISPKQIQVLERLNIDAKALIDTLIDTP
ncbi:hypothetical protein F4810DRAFT_269910 [Camillea tinctor]|nr:hypothetical protein F4810DRAFT_269910 [Camillea tinctor]